MFKTVFIDTIGCPQLMIDIGFSFILAQFFGIIDFRYGFRVFFICFLVMYFCFPLFR